MAIKNVFCWCMMINVWLGCSHNMWPYCMTKEVKAVWEDGFRSLSLLCPTTLHKGRARVGPEFWRPAWHAWGQGRSQMTWLDLAWPCLSAYITFIFFLFFSLFFHIFPLFLFHASCATSAFDSESDNSQVSSFLFLMFLFTNISQPGTIQDPF